MSEYKPDTWVVFKLPESIEKNAYKVLGGWSGGYLDGDSWRLNSGVAKVERDGDYYLFIGFSGSVYRCHKGSYRITMATNGTANQMSEAGCTLLGNMDDWTLLDVEQEQ